MDQSTDPHTSEPTPSRFNERPALVFWETTKACPLACRHCRTEAQHQPLPGELNTTEARHLLEAIRDFGDPAPVLVLTGGDLLMRQDIFELIPLARDLGLHVAVAPAASPLLNHDAISRFAQLGVHALSLSIDGLAPVHDSIRGIPGTFAHTLDMARTAQLEGLQVQVNTVVMERTLPDLADLAHLLLTEGIRVWEVFFLIPTGRARNDQVPTADASEDVVNFLLDASRHRLLVRTVEAPFIRRALEQRNHHPYEGGTLYKQLCARLDALAGPCGETFHVGRSGTLDGDGILFVGFDGTITPGGLMPLPTGNVRGDALAQVYRHHPVFQAIRQRNLHGVCGTCPERWRCGGSRARSYAMTGDPLQSDPACIRVTTPA